MPELIDIARTSNAAVTGAPERQLGALPVDWWLGCFEDASLGRGGETAVVTAPSPRLAACDKTAVFQSGIRPRPLSRTVPTTVVGVIHFDSGIRLLTQDFLDDTVRPFIEESQPAAGDRVRVGYLAFGGPGGAGAAALPNSAPTRLQPIVALHDLMRTTGGSADLVAETLGASRRSVYNWLKGKPVRDEFAVRATRLQQLLRPMREEWHPEALSAWLNDGDPSPAQLAAADQWLELQERVRAALRPLTPQPEHDVELRGEPEAWPRAALAAVLEEFRAHATPGEARDWRPRELTGLSPEPEE